MLSNYKSENTIAIPIKDIYTDRHGFLNDKAFYHFIARNRDLFKKTPYYLICLNIDLRKANAQSIAYGDYVLRKFVLALDEYCVFRIQGEKFNVLVTEQQREGIKKILDTKNENYDVYYGMVDKRFIVETENDVKDYVREGISLMYEYKSNTKKNADKGVIGNKGNTPSELQETATRKYKQTMWYSIITVQITKPSYDEFTIYVFPTELKAPLQSIPSVVVVSDNLSYRTFYDNNINFGRKGFIFSVNTRFDRAGHMNTAIFHTGNENGECKYHIETKEGICVPANFGKRITPTREIYPIRKNIQGLCDYVTLEDGNAVINTEGIVVGADNRRYSVYMDDEAIDLILVEDTRADRTHDNEREEMR